MGGKPRGKATINPSALRVFRENLAALAELHGRKALFGPAGVSEANFSRMLGKKAHPIDNPGLFTVKAIAEAAGTTVGALLGETPRVLTVADRDSIREAIEAIARTVGLQVGIGASSVTPVEEDNVLEFVAYRPGKQKARQSFSFDVAREDFKEKDFDYPRPWHYWTSDEDPDELPGLAAGPKGVPNLLNSREGRAREVFDEINRIVRVIGDSMVDRYYDGDLVRVDTMNRDPLRGDPIAVYCDELGGSLLGFYRPDGERVVLVKKNKPRYEDVILPVSGWVLLGPVVELVSRRERRERV